MIQVNGLTKSYGFQKLFENVSFSINAGEKIGLIGRNGHGKTTLLRILYGQETPDSGTINMPKNYTLGYLEQTPQFTRTSIIEECTAALPPEHKDDRWRAEKILFGLGFTREDLEQPPSVFSGGFQVRLSLTRLLCSQPKMLFLDEPTNFLDVVSIRWLKKFLNEWKNEFILITHDREFMDSVITHTLAIHRGKMRKLPGDTEKMYLQLAQDEEIYEKTRMNDEKEKKRIEIFINRFRAKARLAGMVQSRIKTLAKKEKQDRLQEIKDLEFSFNYHRFPGKTSVEITSLAFGYDPTRPLIRDLDFTIRHQDRVAVIGKNGRGKSTLLRLLTGELTPWQGNIEFHSKSMVGYFGQTNRDTLTPHLTVEEEILLSNPDIGREGARNIAGAMLFEGDAATKKIAVLSGGEKARVYLGKILATPCNMLILDEPTNHLDMQASDALLQALDNFDGTIVIVTHNEMFLHSLAQRLVVFDTQENRNTPFVYESGYEDFLENVGWSDEKLNPVYPAQNTGSLNRKDLRKLRAEILTEKQKILNPLKIQMEQLERDIENIDKEITDRNNALIESTRNGNGQEIGNIAKNINELQLKINKLLEELEIATVEYEKYEKIFETKLLDIE